MAEAPLTVRLATERDQEAIISLLDEAAAWLRTQETDQWARPWRNEQDRRNRIRRDLRAGKTWILEDGHWPVATFTADREHNHQEMPVWPERSRGDQAVYVCRLTVRQSHAGQKLGAELLNWIGLSFRERYGTEWIRVNVWTTNHELQDYYKDQGFEFHAESQDPSYPSGALFQKATAGIELAVPALFQVPGPGEAG